MLADILVPWLSWLELHQLYLEDNRIVIVLYSTESETVCPLCGQPSTRVHSHYVRNLADLPCIGCALQLQAHLRKFFCRNPACLRQVFCERLSGLAAPHARRTERLQQEQRQLGLTMGGEPGARTAQRQGMPVSGDTILRLVRDTSPPAPPTPRALGVDDWALRKGQTYGTILVDLERHRPVDLLPDRSAASLARWLQEHPGVEIISRDRANDYAEGASSGAPKAVQVADRFHLLHNIRDVLQRILDRHQAALRRAVTESRTAELPACKGGMHAADSSGSTEAKTSEPETLTTVPCQERLPTASRRPTKADQQKQARRAARRSRYDLVRSLHAEGLSQRQIARQLHMSIHTVRRFLVADEFPERATRQIDSKLDPFIPYLREQLAAGRDNAMQLWREIRDQFGYSGSRPLVSRWVAHHRCLCPEASADQPRPKRGRGRPPTQAVERPHPVRRLSAQQAAWLLVENPADLEDKDRSIIEHLRQRSTDIDIAYPLAQEFILMVRQRSGSSFADWLIRVKATGIPELASFAAGLRRDQAAVMAALSLPYSNGQTEGQINRLKLIKRSMYGRAGFDLLRKRVLAA